MTTFPSYLLNKRFYFKCLDNCMTVDNEFVKNLDLEKLVDEFGRMRSRRHPVT